MLGIVDLVFESDDRLVVRDYKTAGRKWNQGNAESNAGQLELYSELVKRLLPGRNDKKSKSGKNTAFTMSQRYVSSEALMGANSTSDLDERKP